MNKWKKTLAPLLTAALLLGLAPTAALAAAAELIQEPTLVYTQVYNFDEHDAARVWNMDGHPLTVTMQNGKITERPAAVDDGTLTAFLEDGTGLAGYRDSAGRTVISPAYTAILQWEVAPEQGTIPVRKGEKWGLIDKAGETVSDFTYDDMSTLPHSDSYFEVVRGEKSGVIDPAGQVILPPVYEDILRADTLADGRAVFQALKGDRTGVVDTRNEVVIPFVYDALEFGAFELGAFDGGALLPFGVADPGGGYRYGYLDSTGRVAVAPDYSGADSFSGGMARVCRDGKYGYIDAAGEEVIPCAFPWADDFNDSGAAVVGDEGSNRALIDKSGRLLTGYDYYYIDTISGDGDLYMAAKANGDRLIWGYLDNGGREAIPFLYGNVDAFFYGLAVVAIDGGEGRLKYGIIDERGGSVLPCAYDLVGKYWEEVPIFVSDYVWVAERDEGTGRYRYGVVKLDRNAAPGPALGTVTAVPASRPVLVNGTQAAFDVYAVRDETGEDTNYFRLRDLASVLSGTRAQFQVGWDGSVRITTGTAYTADGTEMSTPFSGPQPISGEKTATLVNGSPAELDSIVLKDAAGNGYTYYKLGDLGEVIGFTVDWNQAAGAIVISTESR